MLRKYLNISALIRQCFDDNKASKVTDKSFKMLVVTKTLETEVTLDEVMNHGRWRTLSIPLHYKVNLELCKKKVAAMVPS